MCVCVCVFMFTSLFTILQLDHIFLSERVKENKTLTNSIHNKKIA